MEKKQECTNTTAGNQKEVAPAEEDLIRARVALFRLYERAIALALEAEQVKNGREEAAGRLAGQPAAESTGERDERNSQGS